MSEVHRSSLKRYAQRLPQKFSSPEELKAFLSKANAQRHYAATLANYIKYIGEGFEDYRKVIKFEKTRPDLIIPNDDKVRLLIETLDGPFKTLALVLCYTGLRLTEALYLLKNFQKDIAIRRGEIAVYPLGLLRKSKQAFYAYMPLWLVGRLSSSDVQCKYREIGKKFRKAGIATKYLRKWNFNALIRAGVDMMIAEFIQGRSFRIVGGTNYLGAMERGAEAYQKASPFLNNLLESK